jgi:uncharacterized membrane protein
MASEHTERRLNGSRHKAGTAVVAKRKIPLTAGNLTLVVRLLIALTITETTPSLHSKQKFLYTFLRLIHICFLLQMQIESLQKKSIKTKQSIYFPHFLKNTLQGETLKMQTLIM